MAGKEVVTDNGVPYEHVTEDKPWMALGLGQCHFKIGLADRDAVACARRLFECQVPTRDIATGCRH